MSIRLAGPIHPLHNRPKAFIKKLNRQNTKGSEEKWQATYGPVIYMDIVINSS